MKKLLIALCLFTLGVSIYSCSPDNPDTPSGPPAVVDDVSVALTANGVQDYVLTNRNNEIEYITEITFPQNSNWTAPTIEQTVSPIFAVFESNVKFIDSNGKNVTSIDVNIADGAVTMKLNKVGGNFDYLRSGTFTMVVKAVVDGNVSTQQLDAYAESGLESESRFYDQSPSNSTPASKATVYPRESAWADMEGIELEMTINRGQDSYTMEEKDDYLVYSSAVTFGSTLDGWVAPTFEQSFDEIVDVARGNARVLFEDGQVVSGAGISLTANKLTIKFDRVGGSFDYLKDRVVTIVVDVSVKKSVTTEQLDQFKSNGFVSKAMFYAAGPSYNVESNEVEVRTAIGGAYTVKGDPYDYPYKLNVIYMVPSDIETNPDYKRRLSTMLLNFQLFICDWMEHWGYGRRSFGLPLLESGLVDIVTVFGPGDRDFYLDIYNIRQEVYTTYERKNLVPRSDHYLVITAANGNLMNMPFFGSGDWAFCIDVPGMSQETLPTDGSALIGGMLHEAGHGALNLPHVGPTATQQSDPGFGIPLMGAGNISYGKEPTFFHETSAAILVTGQLSALSTGTFYDQVDATVKQPHVTINGNQCRVQGTFTSDKTVKDVNVRFYKADEVFLGGGHGYWSMAWRTDAINNSSYDVTIPINELRTFGEVTPGYRLVKLGISIPNSNGVTTSMTTPATYRVVDQGGGNYTLTTTTLSSEQWTVTTSHPLPTYSGNAIGNLVDGNANTYMMLTRPGWTFQGVTVPEGDAVWAAVDMQTKQTFNTITLHSYMASYYVPDKVTFYTSDDGVNYTMLKTATLSKLTMAPNVISLDGNVECRYLKMTYDQWDVSAPMPIMEFSELVLDKN